MLKGLMSAMKQRVLSDEPPDSSQHRDDEEQPASPGQQHTLAGDPSTSVEPALAAEPATPPRGFLSRADELAGGACLPSPSQYWSGEDEPVPNTSLTEQAGADLPASALLTDEARHAADLNLPAPLPLALSPHASAESSHIRPVVPAHQPPAAADALVTSPPATAESPALEADQLPAPGAHVIPLHITAEGLDNSGSRHASAGSPDSNGSPCAPAESPDNNGTTSVGTSPGSVGGQVTGSTTPDSPDAAAAHRPVTWTTPLRVNALYSSASDEEAPSAGNSQHARSAGRSTSPLGLRAIYSPASRRKAPSEFHCQQPTYAANGTATPSTVVKKLPFLEPSIAPGSGSANSSFAGPRQTVSNQPLTGEFLSELSSSHSGVSIVREHAAASAGSAATLSETAAATGEAPEALQQPGRGTGSSSSTLLTRQVLAKTVPAQGPGRGTGTGSSILLTGQVLGDPGTAPSEPALHASSFQHLGQPAQPPRVTLPVTGDLTAAEIVHTPSPASSTTAQQAQLPDPAAQPSPGSACIVEALFADSAGIDDAAAAAGSGAVLAATLGPALAVRSGGDTPVAHPGTPSSAIAAAAEAAVREVDAGSTVKAPAQPQAQAAQVKLQMKVDGLAADSTVSLELQVMPHSRRLYHREFAMAFKDRYMHELPDFNQACRDLLRKHMTTEDIMRAALHLQQAQQPRGRQYPRSISLPTTPGGLAFIPEYGQGFQGQGFNRSNSASSYYSASPLGHGHGPSSARHPFRPPAQAPYAQSAYGTGPDAAANSPMTAGNGSSGAPWPQFSRQAPPPHHAAWPPSEGQDEARWQVSQPQHQGEEQPPSRGRRMAQPACRADQVPRWGQAAEGDDGMENKYSQVHSNGSSAAAVQGVSDGRFAGIVQVPPTLRISHTHPQPGQGTPSAATASEQQSIPTPPSPPRHAEASRSLDLRSPFRISRDQLGSPGSRLSARHSLQPQQDVQQAKQEAAWGTVDTHGPVAGAAAKQAQQTPPKAASASLAEQLKTAAGWVMGGSPTAEDADEAAAAEGQPPEIPPAATPPARAQPQKSDSKIWSAANPLFDSTDAGPAEFAPAPPGLPEAAPDVPAADALANKVPTPAAPELDSAALAVRQVEAEQASAAQPEHDAQQAQQAQQALPSILQEKLDPTSGHFDYYFKTAWNAMDPESRAAVIRSADADLEAAKRQMQPFIQPESHHFVQNAALAWRALTSGEKVRLQDKGRMLSTLDVPAGHARTLARSLGSDPEMAKEWDALAQAERDALLVRVKAGQLELGTARFLRAEPPSTPGSMHSRPSTSRPAKRAATQLTQWLEQAEQAQQAEEQEHDPVDAAPGGKGRRSLAHPLMPGSGENGSGLIPASWIQEETQDSRKRYADWTETGSRASEASAAASGSAESEAEYSEGGGSYDLVNWQPPGAGMYADKAAAVQTHLLQQEWDGLVQHDSRVPLPSHEAGPGPQRSSARAGQRAQRPLHAGHDSSNDVWQHDRFTELESAAAAGSEDTSDEWAGFGSRAPRSSNQPSRRLSSQGSLLGPQSGAHAAPSAQLQKVPQRAPPAKRLDQRAPSDPWDQVAQEHADELQRSAASCRKELLGLINPAPETVAASMLAVDASPELLDSFGGVEADAPAADAWPGRSSSGSHRPAKAALQPALSGDAMASRPQRQAGQPLSNTLAGREPSQAVTAAREQLLEPMGSARSPSAGAVKPAGGPDSKAASSAAAAAAGPHPGGDASDGQQQSGDWRSAARLFIFGGQKPPGELAPGRAAASMVQKLLQSQAGSPSTAAAKPAPVNPAGSQPPATNAAASSTMHQPALAAAAPTSVSAPGVRAAAAARAAAVPAGVAGFARMPSSSAGTAPSLPVCATEGPSSQAKGLLSSAAGSAAGCVPGRRPTAAAKPISQMPNTPVAAPATAARHGPSDCPAAGPKPGAGVPDISPAADAKRRWWEKGDVADKLKDISVASTRQADNTLAMTAEVDEFEEQGLLSPTAHPTSSRIRVRRTVKRSLSTSTVMRRPPQHPPSHGVKAPLRSASSSAVGMPRPGGLRATSSTAAAIVGRLAARVGAGPAAKRARPSMTSMSGPARATSAASSSTVKVERWWEKADVQDKLDNVPKAGERLADNTLKVEVTKDEFEELGLLEAEDNTSYFSKLAGVAGARADPSKMLRAAQVASKASTSAASQSTRVSVFERLGPAKSSMPVPDDLDFPGMLPPSTNSSPEQPKGPAASGTSVFERPAPVTTTLASRSRTSGTPPALPSGGSRVQQPVRSQGSDRSAGLASLSQRAAAFLSKQPAAAVPAAAAAAQAADTPPRSTGLPTSYTKARRLSQPAAQPAPAAPAAASAAGETLSAASTTSPAKSPSSSAAAHPDAPINLYKLAARCGADMAQVLAKEDQILAEMKRLWQQRHPGRVPKTRDYIEAGIVRSDVIYTVRDEDLIMAAINSVLQPQQPAVEVQAAPQASVLPAALFPAARTVPASEGAAHFAARPRAGSGVIPAGALFPTAMALPKSPPPEAPPAAATAAVTTSPPTAAVAPPASRQLFPPQLSRTSSAGPSAGATATATAQPPTAASPTPSSRAQLPPAEAAAPINLYRVASSCGAQIAAVVAKEAEIMAAMAKLWQQRHPGRMPMMREYLEGGVMQRVAAYTRADEDLMVMAIKHVMGRRADTDSARALPAC